jgi:hypothetical protein
MQGAFFLVAVGVAVAAQPGVGHAYAQDVPTPSLPGVDVPQVELPPVETVVPAPSLPTPDVPAVKVPSLPAAEVPAVPAPSTPRLPAVSPSLPSSGSGTGGLGGGPAGGGGSAGAGGGAAVAGGSAGAGFGPGGVGAAGGSALTVASRAAGRGAPRSARRGARGVLGTRYRTRRSLARGLRGCLGEITPRRRKLLILRYGIGGFEPRPGREVARILEISIPEYRTSRQRALRGLVRAARRSSCERSALTFAEITSLLAAAAPQAFLDPVYVSSEGDGGSGEQGEILGRRSSSRETGEAPRPDGGGGVPSGVVVQDEGGLPIVAVALLTLLLVALLWFLAVRPARSAVARRRAYRSYISRRDS